MAKYVNSFSLLDDQEEDDVTTIVDRLVKKGDESLCTAQKDKESSQSVTNGRGHRSTQFESRDYKYSRDRSWGVIEDDGHLQGEGNDSTEVDRTDKETDGWKSVRRSNVKVHANNGDSFGDWPSRNYRNKNWSHRRGRRSDREQFRNYGAANGQKKRYSAGNHSYDGERSGNGDNQIQGNDGGNGDMRYENGDRGYSNQPRDGGFVDGQKRYRNGNRGGYGGGRQGYYRDQVQDNDASSGQQNGEGVTFGENNEVGEEGTYSRRNPDYSGERRGRSEYRGRGGRGRGRGRGRFEFRRTGSDEVEETGNADDQRVVNAEDVDGSGGVAATVLNASEAAAAEEEKNASEAVNGDIRDPMKQDKSNELERKRKENEEEARRKKKEEEEKEAALMTLDQYYEKLRKEKEKLLDVKPEKTEIRRVAIDKDFEKMQVVERKQEVIDDRWLSICKPKMKESLKGQVTKSSKIEDSDLNNSAAKLKNEGSLKMTDNFEKGKGRRPVVVEAHEIFSSAFRPRRFGGRRDGGDRGNPRDDGRGRVGGSEQGRFRNAVNGGVAQTDRDAAAPAPRRSRHPPPPQPEDFPVLAPVATSTPIPPSEKAQL